MVWRTTLFQKEVVITHQCAVSLLPRGLQKMKLLQ
jgi:hypothetical protein